MTGKDKISELDAEIQSAHMEIDGCWKGVPEGDLSSRIHHVYERAEEREGKLEDAVEYASQILHYVRNNFDPGGRITTALRTMQKKAEI